MVWFIIISYDIVSRNDYNAHSWEFYRLKWWTYMCRWKDNTCWYEVDITNDEKVANMHTLKNVLLSSRVRIFIRGRNHCIYRSGFLSPCVCYRKMCMLDILCVTFYYSFLVSTFSPVSCVVCQQFLKISMLQVCANEKYVHLQLDCYMSYTICHYCE